MHEGRTRFSQRVQEHVRLELGVHVVQSQLAQQRVLFGLADRSVHGCLSNR